jgi:4-oxalomesaconate hydratase
MLIRGGRRVLVFSAHAADFCSRAGGAIIRLVDAGSTVLVYDMTYGEKCESPALWARDPKPTIDEVKEIRKQEMEAAAAALGASIACLDYGDSPLLIGPERRQQVMEVFREFQPDLVLTHWKDDIQIGRAHV